MSLLLLNDNADEETGYFSNSKSSKFSQLQSGVAYKSVADKKACKKVKPFPHAV